MTQADQELVDHLESVWGSIAELGDSLSEAEWKTETECPGWTVQDNAVHVFSLEASLLGRPVPEHDVPDLAHVKNEPGQRNEVWVDAYRSASGPEVLAEFRDVTAERLAALRALDDDGFGADSWTPVGPGAVRDLLPFRIFDSWTHEQDMRRAVGKPGDVSTPAAAFAVGRITGVLGYIVGKKVAPPDGTTVVFRVTDSRAGTIAVSVDGGRAKVLDAVPSDPTVTLTMDTDTLARLGTGRGDPTEIVASGAVQIDGDRDLGRRVATSMNFLF